MITGKALPLWARTARDTAWELATDTVRLRASPSGEGWTVAVSPVGAPEIISYRIRTYSETLKLLRYTRLLYTINLILASGRIEVIPHQFAAALESIPRSSAALSTLAWDIAKWVALDSVSLGK